MSRIIVSCFSNAFGAYGVREAVSRIRSTGISHLELALRGHNLGGLVIPENAVITPENDDATVETFVQLMESQGVRASACNVGGGDPLTEEGLILTERRMRFARKWFGVEVVVSGAGQPRDSSERAILVRNLRRLGALARELGLTIALETHKGPTQNATAQLELMEEVDDPAVRLNFDTGNIAYYNPGLDPAEELAQVVSLVRNVHLKDNRGLSEDWFFPALGDGGAVDFRRIHEILVEAGFQGACAIEIEGIGGEEEPGLEARVERIRRSVAHLEASGFRT